MLTEKVFFHVTAFLLTVVATGHLIRAVSGWDVTVDA